VLTTVSLRDGNGKLGEDDLRGYDPPLTNSFIAQLLTTKSTADGELVRLQWSSADVYVLFTNVPHVCRTFEIS
jgi:hypothetical protein